MTRKTFPSDTHKTLCLAGNNKIVVLFWMIYPEMFLLLVRNKSGVVFQTRCSPNIQPTQEWGTSSINSVLSYPGVREPLRMLPGLCTYIVMYALAASQPPDIWCNSALDHPWLVNTRSRLTYCNYIPPLTSLGSQKLHRNPVTISQIRETRFLRPLSF